jgi:hypothetical protein
VRQAFLAIRARLSRPEEAVLRVRLLRLAALSGSAFPGSSGHPMIATIVHLNRNEKNTRHWLFSVLVFLAFLREQAFCLSKSEIVLERFGPLWPEVGGAV